MVNGPQKLPSLGRVAVVFFAAAKLVNQYICPGVNISVSLLHIDLSIDAGILPS